jgi:N-acetylglucosaminyl-diphospho-decaprenol L-rhamnosyltransferase
MSAEKPTREASEVSIIVVSYNSKQYLARSLEAVTGTARELIVVDNASTDGSREFVRSCFPSAQLIALDSNVGFGTACNAGMRVATGTFVLLMNPDAWPKGNSIAELVRYAEAQPNIGAVGPRLRGLDGRLHQSSFGYPTLFWLGRPAVTSFPQRRSLARRGLAALRNTISVANRRKGVFVVAAALLLRREAVRSIGGFDSRFFMFNEDVDLCWRLLQAGWRVEVCEGAEFAHAGGASTRAAWTSMYREQLRGHLLFLVKHHGLRQAEIARHVLLLTTGARALLGRDESATLRETAEWLASGRVASLLRPTD